MTSQAGLIPAIKFLDALGFTGLFRVQVHHERGQSAQYHLVDAVFLMLIGLVGGKIEKSNRGQTRMALT